MVYADTSVFVALLVKDSNSDKALRLLEKLRQPLAFNKFLRLEIGNALQLGLAEDKLNERDVSIAELMLEGMINSRQIREIEPDWDNVFDRSRGLSLAHTKQIYSRSLDIIHVACAMEIQVRNFLSFDTRQKQLADHAGLSLIA